MSSEHSRSLARLAGYLERGHFAGRRIILADPDDPSGRTRNIYEDLDQDPGEERMALLTLYPEYAKAQAAGDESGAGLRTMTHAEALRDIERMVRRFGYIIASIERDILS